jgi:hypothetical protein
MSAAGPLLPELAGFSSEYSSGAGLLNSMASCPGAGARCSLEAMAPLREAARGKRRTSWSTRQAFP